MIHKYLMNTLELMDKDVSFVNRKSIEVLVSLSMSEETLGTTRVRKVTLGSFPLGLLTHTVPCWIVYLVFNEIYV